MKLRNLNIQQQLTFSFLLIFILIAIIGISAFNQTKEIQKNVDHLYNNSLKVRRIIGDINYQILSTRIEYRNILLSSDEETYLTSLSNRINHFQNALMLTEDLYNPYTGNTNDIKELREALVFWNLLQEEHLNKNKNLIRDTLNKQKHITNLLFEIEKGGSIVIAREELISKINNISNYTKNKSDFFYNQAQASYKSLIARFIITLVSALVIAIIMIYFISRNIRKPIQELMDTANDFRKGNYYSRSKYNLKNEFGTLSNSYNELAEEIQSNINLSETLKTITTKLFKDNEAKSFCKNLLITLLEKTNSQLACIYVLNENGTQFLKYQSIGLNNKVNKSFSAIEYEGELGIVSNSKKIIHIKDIPEDTQFIVSGIAGHAYPKEIIHIPIYFDKEVVTIISLASIYQYSENTINLINSLHSLLISRIYGVFAFTKLEKTNLELENSLKELEQQKIELNALSSELKVQNNELETQKSQLLKAGKLKTNFMSNMSHELRTPLNSVIALSSVLSRNLKDKINDEHYSYIDIIERNGKQLLNLINEILDIQKIEAGHIDIKYSLFNPNNSMQDIIDLLKPQADKKGIDLLFIPTEGQDQINCDLKMFNHIFQNLISNGIKFTEAGKVEVSLKTSNKNLIVEILDTGIGIKEEDFEVIFEEFKQVDSSTTKRYEGTGLGLSIAKKYIEILGGEIKIKSKINQGTVFTVIIPCEKNSNNSRNNEKNSENFENNYLKNEEYFNKTKNINPEDINILIVEDNEAASIQIEYILKSKGFKTAISRNGREAIKLLSTYTPDIIILDLMMPEIDGFGVLKQIRNDEKTANIPVIILTAKFITKTELAELKRNNIFQILQKGNVEKEHLLNTIYNVFSKTNNIINKPEKKSLNKNEKNKIMIVEDNADNLATIKALIPTDIETIETQDGEKAFEIILEQKPTLILLDLALKNISGIDILKQIRGNETVRETPTIVITASAMPEDKEKILTYGFDDYISKPIDINLFTTILNKYLL